MPDETLEKAEKTSQDSEMERQSESETPLTLEMEEETREKPLAYAKLIVTHSKKAFGIGVGIHVFMLFLTVILILSGYDIMKPDFTTLPLSLDEDSTKLRADAWQNVHTDDSITPSSSVTSGQKERSILYMPLELFYESESGNVFTRENLLKIQENEDALFSDPEYKSQLCQMQTIGSNQTCKRPLSIIRFFDGTYKGIDATFEDPDFNNIITVLTKAKNITMTSAILNFHIGRHAVIDRDKNIASSKYTRSLLYFGWPLKGYKSTENKDYEQRKKLDKVIADLYTDRLDEIYKDKLGDVNFYYFNLALMTKAIESQVIYDMALAIASFIFIFAFMLLQTGSLWITSWGIFSIISSFNIANFIYRVIFDYKYIGIFHVLAIFIILGVGSDNIFVFMDTWKEYGRNHPNSDLATRLSVVFKSAAKATFITSLTTTIAFLSNVQSPLLAVSSFGLFSAILVAVNYGSCTLFLPTVIIFHEQRRKGRCCFWDMCRRTRPEQPIEIPEIGEETENNEIPSSNKGNFVIKFLAGWFYEKVITHKYVRWGVLMFFFIMVCVFLGFAAKLGPNKEETQVFGENTNWGKVADMRKSAFLPSQEDNVLAVHIIWGLKEQDRSDCHMTDYKCKGRTVFDNSFDMNPPPCQTALLKFCAELQTLPSEQEKNLRLRRSEITGKVEVQCVFSRLDEWMEIESNKTKYPAGSDFTLPTSGEKIIPLMAANSQLFNVSRLPDTYYRFFEVALGYFIFDGKSPEYANTYDFEVFSPLVGGSLDQGITGGNNYILMQGNKYGHRLKFLAIALNTTINPRTLSYKEGLPIYRDWEDFVNKHIKEMPPSCSNGFQATVGYDNTWHWLKVQEILVWSAITGILIGLFSSFFVIVIATTNIIVGALASLTISLITCCVLGTITMIGWKLGVLESLNLTLVVGLAVDYVVHLAEGYMHLVGEDRLTKVQHTLTHVGISVLSGACSTLGASIFMLGAKIVFFFQFGIFMFCTIGLSIFFSLLFFTTVLALVGPQEDEKGSIKPAVTYCIDHIRGKRKNNTHCDRCHGKGFVPFSNEQGQ